MSSIQLRLNVALLGVMLSTAVVAAQQPVRPMGKSRQAAGAARRPAAEIKSLINGVAVDGYQKPMPKAHLRLRNLAVNAIEQTATSNAVGEFSFVAHPNVPYVVEIADQAGRIIAVGDVILANAGEVASARVAMPSSLQPTATIFIETASTVVSAATDAGVMVVDPALPKLSPKQ